ncbi:unnamed protein product [Microthlaspi erraticum]|uniref:Uncharacterized protein n=1 Tax=Microthlaspi erraticum TaxID=1685480 RepID=A0A6D2KM33_9BRAS|nr:unnamed protein product [Microthlaspi erraticum]
MVDLLLNLSISKCITTSPKSSSIFPFFTSMIAPDVTKKDLPKIRGSIGSSAYSKTTKSVGIKWPSIFSGTSSKTPCGSLLDQSARIREILVGLKSVILSLAVTEESIKFTLEPRSQKE